MVAKFVNVLNARDLRAEMVNFVLCLFYRD